MSGPFHLRRPRRVSPRETHHGILTATVTRERLMRTSGYILPARLAALVAALALVGSASGCKRAQEAAEEQLIDDAGEAQEIAGVMHALAVVPVAVLASGEGATLASVVLAQERLEDTLGCVEVSTAGNQVSYAFASCAGPTGEGALEGVVSASFGSGAMPGSFSFDLESAGLSLAGRPLELSLSVDAMVADQQRSLTLAGSASSTTESGREARLDAALAWSRDATECVTLDGAVEVTVGLRGLSLRYEGLRRCGPPGTCFEAGTITAEARLGQLEVTFAFDGTDEATVTSKLGTSAVPLACEPTP